MGFLAPQLLWGILLCGVPIAIHLIGRRRAPTVRFAAFDFLLSTEQTKSRQRRFRDLLLMLVRAALITVLALMVVKPLLYRGERQLAIGGGPVSAVIVLDDTLSMQRKASGESLYQRARDRARGVVEGLGSAADIAVLLVSDPSGPQVELSRDVRRTYQAIAESSASFRRGKLDEAISRATQLLATVKGRRRVIVAISDMAAHGLNKEAASVPDGIDLELIDVAPKTIDNTALVDVAYTLAPGLGARSVKLTATACHYGGGSIRRMVRLSVDGQRIASQPISMQAGQCGQVFFTHTFERTGAHKVSFSLPDDALAADNERFLRLDLRDAVRVVLVNGDPSVVRHLDELFFLRTALTSGGDTGGFALSSGAAASLEHISKASTDAVLIANVKSLTEKQAAALSAFVKRGGGLFLAVGDNVTAEGWNNLQQLLPQSLRGAASIEGVSAGGRSLTLGRIAEEHPIWATIGGDGLGAVAFKRVFRLEPSTRDDIRVVASYDDGSPLLVEGTYGEGKVLLYTSTIDRDWTDLPIRPGFVALMQRCLRYLVGALSARSRKPVTVGDRRVLRVPEGEAQLRVLRPTGAVRRVTADELEKGQLDVVVDRPGIYEIQKKLARGGWQPLVGESFAANIAANECDGRKFDPDMLRRQTGAKAAGGEGRVELWHALGMLALLLLSTEAWLTRRG